MKHTHSTDSEQLAPHHNEVWQDLVNIHDKLAISLYHSA